MPFIGSTKGVIRIVVNSAQFTTAAWSAGNFVILDDPIDNATVSSGFIYLSSAASGSNTIVSLKVIDENATPLYYIRSGSVLKRPTGAPVACVGTAGTAIDLNGSSISVIDAIQSDASTTRHEIFNRTVAGSVTASQPYNAFLPSSIFSNIDISWVSADSRLNTGMGRHFLYAPLFIPITKRHVISMGAANSTISSVRYVDPVSGAQSVIPIIQSQKLGHAFSASGISLPAGMGSATADSIIISQLAVDVPSYVHRVRFASSADLFNTAISLPVYLVTFTRKIGVLSSSSQNGSLPFVCAENIPIANRLSGISQEQDFINFMYKGESGHAAFAWDGVKSIFLGITHDPIIHTGVKVSNNIWNNVVVGFNSQGNMATSLSDSQNLVTALVDGYQIGFEAEKFRAMVTSSSAWSAPVTGGGLLSENNVFAINNSVSTPIFINPVGGRKKVTQKLRQ